MCCGRQISLHVKGMQSCGIHAADQLRYSVVVGAVLYSGFGLFSTQSIGLGMLMVTHAAARMSAAMFLHAAITLQGTPHHEGF
jgi:hypothetical protein